MTKYCIMAANHQNQTTIAHRLSKVWEYIAATQEKPSKVEAIGGKSIGFVNELLANGHTMLSAKHDKVEETITTGKPVEMELRIAKTRLITKLATCQPSKPDL